MELSLGPWEQEEHVKLICDDWKNIEFFNLDSYLKNLQNYACTKNKELFFEFMKPEDSVSSNNSNKVEKNETKLNRIHNKKSSINSLTKLKQKPPKLSNNNNNSFSATTININAQLTRIEDLKPPDNFDYIETTINNHLNELKQETSKCQLRPLITIKNSNTSTYTNESPPESAKTRQITTPTIPIITTTNTNNNNNNSSQKLDDLNIYYDYRFSSSDNQYLASTNPSTIYRLQKVLSVPKLNKEENNNTNLKTKPPTSLKLNETFMLMPSLNNEKISPKTTYRLSKPIIAKPETFYKPAVSYISNDNKTIISNQENSSLSNTNNENRSGSSTDDSTEIKKITEIEQIRHKLKEEYNNLLLGSNKLIVRPKSATICTPTIQYLRSTIKKHDTNNNNLSGVQDELKIISLNKLSNGSTQSFASASSSRPNSAVTFKTKNQFINNNNNNNKLRANKPHYIDCESDDLAVELEKSICQFKYDSTLAINPTQAPVNPRNSKLSFYNNNNNNDQQQQQTPKIYVTNPIKHVMIKNNINPIENILTYAAINKQPDTICINGKSMSNMSAVEFEHNKLTNDRNRNKK